MTPDRCLLEEATPAAPPAPGAAMRLPRVPPCLLGAQQHTTVGYDGLRRVALMVTPECGGDFREQAWEAVTTLRAILRQQGEPMTVTVQTVFIADPALAPVAREIFSAYYGEAQPLTLFVAQPPCGGVALALEAWAVSTTGVKVTRHTPQLVTVEHDGLRWIHASAGSFLSDSRSAYVQSSDTFADLERVLRAADASFADVVRVWLYQGGITEKEQGEERYREMNRARSDFFAHVPFAANPRLAAGRGHAVYPASTGIGTQEQGLVGTCLALQTQRRDVQLLSLENPRQTSAFDYPPEYSAKSPKFSRAMALRTGRHVTTWISGTASIRDALTLHPDDVVRQTEVTLDNIERLISPENFAQHGWAGCGARLSDLAKVRVYVKHAHDFAACRKVCEQRLGRIPALYAQADVCRPDLLVEIEGVAFSAAP
jgi:enamine deaminase RidA (YjgF/YER057c/UK114 family)